jgi:drug/metabolite transporter (DMT)-like permease
LNVRPALPPDRIVAGNVLLAKPTTFEASLLMLLSAVLFALMAITIRLASKQLHAFEIAFFRNFFGMIFALPLIYRAGFSVLKTQRLPMYFLRCTIGLCAMLTGFWSLIHLPMAQAIAISYATPLFVTIGAVLVLGEIVRRRRWSAVAIGFLGTLIILKVWTFGSGIFNFAAGVALASSVLSASAAISIKFLSRTEHPVAIVFYMVAIMTPLSLLPALPYWAWPSLEGWGWLVATGFFGTTAHNALTRAYQMGDISALTPINFVQLPVVSLIAWWLFSELPDRYTLIGASIVFASTIYIAHREAVLARRAVTDAEIGPNSAAK